MNGGFLAGCCINSNGFLCVSWKQAKTLLTFRPECTGLFRGEEVGKVFSLFLAGTKEPFTVQTMHGSINGTPWSLIGKHAPHT